MSLIPPAVDPAAPPTNIPNVTASWPYAGHRPSATLVASTAVWNPVHVAAETNWNRPYRKAANGVSYGPPKYKNAHSNADPVPM